MYRSYGLTLETFKELSKLDKVKPELRKEQRLKNYYIRSHTYLQLAANLQDALARFPSPTKKPSSSFFSQKPAQEKYSLDENLLDNRVQLIYSNPQESVRYNVSTFERFCIALKTIEEERLHFRLNIQVYTLLLSILCVFV